MKVDWIKTKPIEEAIWEKGMFANQNSACKLRNKFTIERLTQIFELNELDRQEEEKIVIDFPLVIKAQHKGVTFNAGC